MKSSNLALRFEPEDFAEPEAAPASENDGQNSPAAPPRAYRRFSLDDRTIVIRDQGLRLFRVC
jgi:hypothetical protein